ncbi:MAG: hypothetical protein MZU79_04295 [Anaerotruncus sp.]|nr:hypothetical protein [Anaerotruncus sp.]
MPAQRLIERVMPELMETPVAGAGHLLQVIESFLVFAFLQKGLDQGL